MKFHGIVQIALVVALLRLPASLFAAGDQVKDLLFDLRVGKKDVKISAVRSLGNLHDRRAVPALLELVENRDESKQLRREAIIALGKLEAKETISPITLLAINRDEKSDLRITAIEVLALMKTKKPVRQLASALENPKDRDKVRVAMIGYLDQFAGRAVFPSLKLVLENQNDDRKVRIPVMDLAHRLDPAGVVVVAEHRHPQPRRRSQGSHPRPGDSLFISHSGSDGGGD